MRPGEEGFERTVGLEKEWRTDVGGESGKWWNL